MGEKLTGQDILDAGLDDWRLLLNALFTRYATKNFVTGLALVNRIGEAAEEMNHHPDLDLRYTHLNIKLLTHDVNALTDRDLRLARRISELAAEAGVQAKPDKVQAIELALDTAGSGGVKPFWRAVLGLSDVDGDDDALGDKSGSLPAMWFQKTDEHEPPRQRWHPDVWVPHDVAEQRIADALDAGGTLVSDAAAPSFTILADADGNKVCVCTWQGRSTQGS